MLARINSYPRRMQHRVKGSHREADTYTVFQRFLRGGAPHKTGMAASIP